MPYDYSFCLSALGSIQSYIPSLGPKPKPDSTVYRTSALLNFDVGGIYKVAEWLSLDSPISLRLSGPLSRMRDNSRDLSSQGLKSEGHYNVTTSSPAALTFLGTQ